MIKTARQLKDLINNLSRKNAADAQLLMRNYMMERFLERVSLSPYKDKFILKGGMLVAAMVGLDARSTMDIDATIQGTTVDVDQVSDIVSEIISVHVDDGVSFSLKSVSEIMDEADYPGVRVALDALFDKVRTPVQNRHFDRRCDHPQGDPLYLPVDVRGQIHRSLSLQSRNCSCREAGDRYFPRLYKHKDARFL